MFNKLNVQKKAKVLAGLISVLSFTCMLYGQGVKLENKVGKVVTIVATPAEYVNEHMMQTPPGYGSYYFDYNERQIVVYSKTKIDCTGATEITGKVQLVKGGGKEGTRGSYKGYHIVASSWECMDDEQDGAAEEQMPHKH